MQKIIFSFVEKSFTKAASAKILPKRTYPAKYISVNTQEILDKKVTDLTVENYYFEEIPLSYAHKVICEEGIFETEEFIERFLKF